MKHLTLLLLAMMEMVALASGHESIRGSSGIMQRENKEENDERNLGKSSKGKGKGKVRRANIGLASRALMAPICMLYW